MCDVTEIKNEIKNAYSNNKLSSTLLEFYHQNYSELNLLKIAITELHNNGDIDVLNAFLKLTNSNRDFGLLLQIFELFLPDLNSPVKLVMATIKYLAFLSGDNLRTDMLSKPYEEYLKKDHSRIELSFKIIKSEPSEWGWIFPAAIRAGATMETTEYITKTIDIIHNGPTELLPHAFFALGQINYIDSLLSKEVIRELSEIIINETDDSLLSNAIRSIGYIYIQNNIYKNEFLKSLIAGTKKFTEVSFFTISQYLMFNTKCLPQEIISSILDILLYVNPTNLEIINNIDYSLDHLINLELTDIALNFVESFLEINPNFDITNLYVFTNSTIQKPGILNYSITRFFLSKKSTLCNAAAGILNQIHGEGIKLKVATTLLNTAPPGTLIYLTKKIIGWCFIHPISCASFIISIIELLPDIELNQLQELLFNPIAMNYPGCVSRYLKEKHNENPALLVSQTICIIQERLDQYHAGLKSTWDRQELQPSQLQRETYWRDFNQKMLVSQKHTESKFVLLSLIPKSRILYGRKSIHYSHEPNNNLNRIEVPFNTISHSIEFPRNTNYDPVGLDFMLFKFRIEGLE